VSRESEVAANETRAVGGRVCPWALGVGAKTRSRIVNRLLVRSVPCSIAFIDLDLTK
jgi:hypothetical protein